MTRRDTRELTRFACCVGLLLCAACAEGGALSGPWTTAGGATGAGTPNAGTSSTSAGASNGAGGSASGTGGSASGTGGSAGLRGTAGHGGAPPTSALPTCAIAYDGESGANDVNLAAGQSWTDPNGANGTSSVSESTDNPHSGTRSMKIDLSWNAGYYGGAFGFNWAKYSAARAYDLSKATQLEFWVRTETGTNDHFVLWLSDATGTASSRDQAGGYVPLVTSEWQHFSIPLSAYTGIDWTRVWELDGDTHSKPFGSAGGVTFYLDDVAFTGAACH